MKRAKRRSKMEPVISLINIVFLILIFFMVTGTLSPHRGGGLEFIQTTGLECCAEPDALYISRTGELSYLGEEITSVEEYLATQKGQLQTARLLPERALPAHQLLNIVKQLQLSGADQVIVLTENSPK
ncbi:ExbD/TolR family protein [Kordiimonas sp.]|uniref:ExbD/TolR family protein n=1 Tax=Kordiimonas sp. TaxID=1970157 RepID=UPI003A93DA8D